MPCQSGVSALATALLLMFLFPLSASAAAVDWAHANGSLQRNGSVQVRTLSGSKYSGLQNPSGALAKASQIAATQSPTILLQATASLPLKNIGDACSADTSGTAPSQTANEGTAILPDRSAILTCQMGQWKRSYRVEQPTIRYGGLGNINGDGGVSYCQDDEIVIGGGGFCSGSTPRYFLHQSMPVRPGDVVSASGIYVITGTGWFANCYSGDTTQPAPDAPAQAFAMCLKKQ